ncbi:MAG: hypothetical protein ACK2VD_02545 [Anaerolineae bacterium]|jgi:hypothetical protein
MPSHPDVAHIRVRTFIREIVTVQFDEMDCPECFEYLDHFADLILNGADAARMMPRLHDHLERCAHCREEFEALLAAVRALQ